MNPRDRQRQRILAALAIEWDKHPNLRFGQLVENLIRPPWEDQAKEQEHWGHCIFNTTDDIALVRALEGIG